MCIMFLSYALGFWYGTKLVIEEENFSVGSMLIVSWEATLSEIRCPLF